MASTPPPPKPEKDAEFKSFMDQASAERAAGNLPMAVTLFSQALQVCPHTMMATCHVQGELMATQKAFEKSINPWGKAAQESGKVPIPKVIPPYLKTKCLSWFNAGIIGGFTIGYWGGSLFGGFAWAGLLGIAAYFLTISLADTHSPASNRSHLIVIGIQIGLFAILGSVLGAATGDPLAPKFALLLGLALSFLDGILDWEIYYYVAFWVVFPPIFALAGAGIGALVGLAGAEPALGAAVGALIGACTWYWMMSFFSRPVGTLFVILSFAIGVPLAFVPFPGGPLVGFLAGTMIALAVALGILAFIYNKVFVKDQPPKWVGRIFDKR